MSEDQNEAMRNTMHARIEALRAARLAFWVAVIDSLPVFIVRAAVGFLTALNNMLDSASRLIMRATRRLFGVKDE